MGEGALDTNQRVGRRQLPPHAKAKPLHFVYARKKKVVGLFFSLSQVHVLEERLHVLQCCGDDPLFRLSKMPWTIRVAPRQRLPAHGLSLSNVQVFHDVHPRLPLAWTCETLFANQAYLGLLPHHHLQLAVEVRLSTLAVLLVSLSQRVLGLADVHRRSSMDVLVDGILGGPLRSWRRDGARLADRVEWDFIGNVHRAKGSEGAQDAKTRLVAQGAHHG